MAVAVEPIRPDNLTKNPYEVIPATIYEIIEESPLIRTIRLRPEKPIKFHTGQFIELTRNTAYWGEKARSQRVIFRFISDTMAGALAFRAGEVDVLKILVVEDELAVRQALAEMLGISEGTSKSQLHYAKQKLIKMLKRPDF